MVTMFINPLVGNGTDAAPTLNAIIAQLVVAGGGTLNIGPGLYALQTQPIQISGNNIKVICDPSAVFQAQTGFYTPNWPMVEIRGNNIEWFGGIFDGNGIANGLQLAAANTRVVFRNVEVKNWVQYGIYGSARTSGLFGVYNCYLHGGNQPGVYDNAVAGNTCQLIVRDCWFDGISNFACGVSPSTTGATANFEASGNLFTNCGATGGLAAIYAFQAGNVDWHDNTFINCNAAVHADTCGGGSICDNNATNSTGGVDFFAEVTPYISIERNIARGNTAERGVVVGVGGANTPASLPVLLYGITCNSNKVIKCQGGIGWGTLQQGVFRDNYVESPTNGIAYANANALGTRFQANQSNFASGGTHLTVDASLSPATVFAEDDITDASTIYAQTNGGQIIVE
jgi:hypothetical protein